MSRAVPIVRVVECSHLHRRTMTEVGLDDLLDHVRQVRGAAEAEQLEDDLKYNGRARIDGRSSWFEYERIDP